MSNRFSIFVHILFFFLSSFLTEYERELDSPKSNLSQQEKVVALLGRPKLGEIHKCEIRIKESKEFKVIFVNCDCSFKFNFQLTFSLFFLF